MTGVRAQYEAFPYPERDPKDEAKRLIGGSPSHPVEIDHFLFGGQRDWSQPFRALVAGGGTGDGLIQLAQVLTSAGKPHDIHYIDLSEASRKIAEARAKARGLEVTFHTGSLLDAADLGTFDYIDCCGVLHHLPEPAEGFRALRAALAPGGGLGFMVYAPYGRSGVYPLQEAFGALFEGLEPKARVASARKVLAKLPAGHPFKRNPHLKDHENGDAGFYDLLLHGQDVAMDVQTLLGLMDETGWELVSFTQPALYDPAPLCELPEGMGARARMALAERLHGTIKSHVGYAVARGEGRAPASAAEGDPVPHLRLGQRDQVTKLLANSRPLPINASGIEMPIRLPPKAARLISAVDGRRRLSEVFAEARMDRDEALPLWQRMEGAFTGIGALHYSEGLR
ncbi:class I SAM-dependent methyltransferase [Pseudoroseicyclus tamaricis]|uniref:Class I SAM-dependent methyltransferase n=1 Tax=Pseudoroseicyclus tamaricis TaxID=2705421 RepID=A0A6B2K080_9RHOB|nr:class I SAM-dependent methyltransferase [Pseudoroseicyclus tamaricis]NDV02349.1 class I SAM-dependent methyltransferase [Pseudoroseicyclus tamaricis]